MVVFLTKIWFYTRMVLWAVSAANTSSVVENMTPDALFLPRPLAAPVLGRSPFA